MSDRAVSVAITHALAIGITTVLLSGLFVASGTLLESQENRVGQDQLDEIGSDVATHIQTFDRLNKSGIGVNATVKPTYADQIVNNYNYVIRLVPDGSSGGSVVIEADTLGRDREYELDVDTEFRESTVNGGTIEITLCSEPSGDTYIILGGCE